VPPRRGVSVERHREGILDVDVDVDVDVDDGHDRVREQCR
jgi:hypothetical protein